MSKTQINIWLSIDDNYNDKNENIKAIKDVLYDEDIEYGITLIESGKDARMELMYLSEDLKNTPMYLINVNISKMGKLSSNKLKEILSKIAYQLRKGELKELIGENVKQFFMPCSSDSDLINIEFLNKAYYTDDNCNTISNTIKQVTKDIVANPNNYTSSYYEDISKLDSDLNMEMKQTEESYRLLNKNIPMTEFRKYDKSIEWDEFVKVLYLEYKDNVSKNG